ncbi:MAG: hypothetical protein KDC98_00315, partial [Planctomycetes bacterium]|nr:hypothetical protein [Planctomycetota bacterium]
MDWTALLQIAADWSFWDAPPKATVPRRVLLPTDWTDEWALVVQGVRRCGKSTLLQQLLDRYELDRQKC